MDFNEYIEELVDEEVYELGEIPLWERNSDSAFPVAVDADPVWGITY